MTCEEVIRRISEYLDGELDPGLAEQLMRHFEHCEDCGLVVNTTRKTIDLYCKAEPAPLPEEVQKRLDRAFAEIFKRGTE